MIRHNCPSCAGSDFAVLVREPYTSPGVLRYIHAQYSRGEEDVRRWLDGIDYEVRECSACGLCWQVFYPDMDLAIEVYDRWIDQERWRTEDVERPGMKGYQPILQEVVALADHVQRKNGVPLPQIRALDYGMGWGSWLRIARSFGLDAYGYELSPKRIAHAASLGIPCLDNLAGRKFHIINLEQVLEHVPDPRGLVTQLLDHLEDGGLMKISVPSGKHVARTLRATGTKDLIAPPLVAIRPLEHVNAFTPGSLRQLAAEMGLRVRRAPVMNQLALIFSPSFGSFGRSIGRPLVRGVLGVGTSLVLSR